MKPIKKDEDMHYCQTDVEKLAVDLENADWADVFEQISVTDAFQCFVNKLDLTISNCKFHVNVNKSMSKLKPWTTNNLLIRLQKGKKCIKY